MRGSLLIKGQKHHCSKVDMLNRNEFKPETPVLLHACPNENIYIYTANARGIFERCVCHAPVHASVVVGFCADIAPRVEATKT